MFKKILGLILCVATVASMVVTPASAAKESTWKQDALSGLGIYQENLVTYDGFITSIAGFFYDDMAEMGSAEVFARSMGMLEADEEYNGQTALTVGNALKIAVTALGYKPVLGTDGNYVKKASEIGIAKGLSGGSDAKLKAEVAVEILYEMINVSPLVRTFDGKNGISYQIATDKTLLSINRDIYEVKGMLTSTETTSLYGPAGCAKEDSIIIGGVTYYVGDVRYDSFLGKQVIAYAQETDDTDDTALYVGEIDGRNDVLFIESDDINNIEFVGNRISKITYQQTTTRRKTVSVVASPIVIYNGMYLYPYYQNDFLNKDFELIDYDSDNKYDIIKIVSYQNMIVESIDSAEMIIKNRYRFTGCIDELRLNLLEGDDLKLRIFDSYGAEVNFSAIKIDDVLSVARSRDGKVVDIYISDSPKMAGTITGINNAEHLVFIDKEEYEQTEDFRRFLTASSKTLRVGDLYTFYFDHTGKIAYIKDKTMNDYNVLIKIGYDHEKDEYLAVHMDMDGDWYTTPISKKATFDGIRPGNHETYMENLKIDIKANPEVVILKYNTKNQIINIDTAGAFRRDENTGENAVRTNDSSFCSKTGPYHYRSGRFFQSPTTPSDIIYPENDAKVIVIPESGTSSQDNWEIYSVGSYFKESERGDPYTIEYFNPDPFGFSDLFMVAEAGVSKDIGMSDSLYVVTGIKQILANDEVYTQIEGSVNGFINLSFMGPVADVCYKTEDANGIVTSTAPIQEGDVININLDDEGNIKKVRKAKDNFSLRDSFDGWAYANLYQNHAVINVGKIARIDYETGKMVMTLGGVQVPFRVNPNMQVTVYYGKEGCLSKPFNILNPEDKLMIRTSWGTIEEIVCAKN